MVFKEPVTPAEAGRQIKVWQTDQWTPKAGGQTMEKWSFCVTLELHSCDFIHWYCIELLLNIFLHLEDFQQTSNKSSLSLKHLLQKYDCEFVKTTDLFSMSTPPLQQSIQKFPHFKGYSKQLCPKCGYLSVSIRQSFDISSANKTNTEQITTGFWSKKIVFAPSCSKSSEWVCYE